MNVKLQKYYQKLMEFAKYDYTKEPKAAQKFLSFCVGYDYAQAAELWEFLLLEADTQIASHPMLAIELCDRVLQIFYNKSSTKTFKLVNDNVVMRRALYGLSPNACTGITFDMLVDLLVSNKVNEAEEILKCLLKNTACRSYGSILREVIEKVLIELMKKATAAGKKIDMPRKTSNMLLTYIAKIKGDERALLEQRIKEIY